MKVSLALLLLPSISLSAFAQVSAGTVNVGDALINYQVAGRDVEQQYPRFDADHSRRPRDATSATRCRHALENESPEPGKSSYQVAPRREARFTQPEQFSRVVLSFFREVDNRR